MKKIIFTVLIFLGIILVAKSSSNAIGHAIKQNEIDTLLFSNQNIESQLNVIGNLKTIENITKGEAIYSSNCARCHNLFTPENKNINTWLNVMKRMAPLAGLSDENYKLVCVYLNSKATLKEIISDSTKKEKYIFNSQQW
jgi:cytochrome c2